MTELTGQVLGGRYRVEAFIGQGGMADVYKVRDTQRAVFLAMKILHADLAEDQVFIRNFEREAQTLERLQHPNIVRFYGFEKTQEIAFILMDFIDGLTLRREIFLYKNGLRPGRVLEIMQPVCAALYYAHQLGMIHCDIKPANIITHRNGTIYLTDFGIAHRSESITQPPSGVGSPAYMAPEQFDNKEPTPAVDIYSLGVVMYEMLTGGQRPFTGDSGRASGSTTRRIVWEKKHLDPPSPRTFNPEITPELEAVVMTCLQHHPRRRFKTTMDLLQALELAVRGIQPEDDAQTRVDLPKPGKTAHATRANLAGQPGEAIQPTAEKPAPKTEKAPAAPAHPSSSAAPARTPAEKPASAAGKAQPTAGQVQPAASKVPPAGQNPAETGGKTLLPSVKAAAPQGKPDVESAAGRSQPEAGKSQTAAGKPLPEADKRPGAVGTAKGPEKANPTASKQQPAADKPLTAADKPLPGAERSVLKGKASAPDRAQASAPDRAHLGAGKSQSGVKNEKAGHADRKPAWQHVLSNWLTVGAAALALALIGLAIFSANAKAPGLEQTSETGTGTPKAVAVSGAEIKRTATLPAARTHPANTETPSAPVVATATAEPRTTSTPATGPTPVGGSQRIAFASDRSGSVQVWIMDLDNPENRHQVTNASGGACQPTWSPDGKRIAYTTPCKGPSIYYSGGTIKIIHLADSTITDLPVKAPGIGGAFDPAWSPDGEVLLYTAVLGEKTEIRAINLANLEVRVLANQGTKNAQPAWSRDGKFISYVFSNDQNWEALWYMRPDGESKELLARSERFSEPSWAPDGLHILASMNKGNNIPVLASVNRSDPLAGAEQLLSGAYKMSHASISPDGQWVVFTSEKGSEKPEILLASLDGRSVNALTSNTLRDFHPSWSPK